jgi:hypothetical protein
VWGDGAAAGVVDVRLRGLYEQMYFGPDPDDACRFISGQFKAMVRDLDATANLMFRLGPMPGLKRLGSTRMISIGHASCSQLRTRFLRSAPRRVTDRGSLSLLIADWSTSSPTTTWR